MKYHIVNPITNEILCTTDKKENAETILNALGWMFSETGGDYIEYYIQVEQNSQRASD